MSRSRRFAAALGLLAVLLVASGTHSTFAGGKLDSPEAKLRARIADLHAEVAVLDVECAAARQNLLESLKRLGKLELGDKERILSEIKGEVRQLQVAAQSVPTGGPKALARRFERDAEKSANKQSKEQGKLIAAFLKGGEEGENALDQLAEIEFQAKFDSARAESDRMKADFLKKCRLLYQKKLELADAEAEYKATR